MAFEKELIGLPLLSSLVDVSGVDESDAGVDEHSVVVSSCPLVTTANIVITMARANKKLQMVDLSMMLSWCLIQEEISNVTIE